MVQNGKQNLYVPSIKNMIHEWDLKCRCRNELIINQNFMWKSYTDTGEI